jgi:glycosyltransferase involved in cell wall biosynthesis
MRNPTFWIVTPLSEDPDTVRSLHERLAALIESEHARCALMVVDSANSRTDDERARPPPPRRSVTVSVVIPVLNEAATLAELCRRLRQVLEPLVESHEIIFVGGDSDDGTEKTIVEAHLADPRVKLLWLSRNFGHQEALTAGLDYAAGDAVITMDGDLQHPPELIPQLLARWREGYEVVTTMRLSTADAGLLKRASSHWFYAALNRLSDVKLTEGSADFRLLDRAAVEAIRHMPERSRFLRGMVQWIGYSQTTVPYHADARKAGNSKFSASRLFRLALLATLAFSAAPLYLVAALGFALAALSFTYGLFAVILKLVADVPLIGWPSLLASVLFTAGMQLIAVGVIGAYVAKVFEETKGRPVYIVRRAYGFAEKRQAEADVVPDTQRER